MPIFNQTLTNREVFASLFILFPEQIFYYIPVRLVYVAVILLDIYVGDAVVPDVVQPLVHGSLVNAELIARYACP